MSTMRVMTLAFLVITVGACRQGDERDVSRDTDAGGIGTDTGMAGMEGMRGGMAGMGSTPMMADMDAHMGTMRNASADSMKAMLPMHRQMVANLISQLEREMRDMKMTGDAAWNATIDSLRQDLRVMPDLSAQALRDLMPAHSLRVRRVTDTHRSMMAGMRH
jgi:hypothetical protein